MGGAAPEPGTGSALNPYGIGDAVITDDLGTVHRGRDPKSGRPVMVRLLWHSLNGPDEVRRFDEQLSAAGKVRHPNVVPVLAWGEVRGLPYVVTEDVGGYRLAELLGSGRPPTRPAVITLLRELARGIGHAHSMGVAHGAIRPSAVMMAPNGAPMLTDFGVGALVREPDGIGKGRVAPERLRGGPATPAGDVHAYAATARSLLAGPPQSARQLSRHDAEVLERGVAGDPGQRWASCAELLEALADPAPQERSVARSWKAIAAVGVAALLAVSGGILVSGRAPRPGAPRRPEPVAAASPTTDAMSPSPEPVALVPTAAPQLPQTPRPSPVGTPRPAATSNPTATSAPPAQSGVSIALSQFSVRAGSNLNVIGKGFDPSQQYVIHLVQGGQSWLVQPPASPRSDGTFVNPIQVPSQANPGSAQVVACEYTGSHSPPGDCDRQSLQVGP